MSKKMIIKSNRAHKNVITQLGPFFTNRVLTEIKVWISNHIHQFVVITYPCPTLASEITVQVVVWMSNYITLFNVGAIIYPCPHHSAS